MPTESAEPEREAASAEAASAFDLLSDPARVAIVRELAASESPLTFSALRERVGIRDSGRFNYHLGRLRGRLVERTPAGYVLTADAERVVRLF